MYKSGMRIISAETRMVLCPFQEKWGNELSQGELRLITFYRQFSFTKGIWLNLMFKVEFESTSTNILHVEPSPSIRHTEYSCLKR